MKNLLKRIHIFLWNNFAKPSEDSEHLFIPYSLLSIISFSVFYVFHELGYGLYEKEAFISRIASLILSVFFSLKNYWPSKLNKIKFYLWPCFLVFTLPYFDFYIAITNNFHELLIMNFLIGIFQIIILTNLFVGIVAIFVGIILAVSLFVLQGGDISIFTLSPLFAQDMVYAFYIFAVSAFFLYVKSKAQNYQLNAIKNLANVIAHEMRTPLRTIASYSTITKQNLPHLIDNNIKISQYIKNNEILQKTLELHDIDSSNYQILHDAINTIIEETKNSFVAIDMLLMQISIKYNNHSAVDLLPIKKTVENSIRKYNFFPQEKTLLHLNISHDFFLLGNEILLTHVMFNLFKNSLYVIKKYNKGAIYIWTEKNKKYNELHFRDTSMGIKSDTLPFIFNSFFSSRSCAGGVGLSYCKQAMEMFKGKIECKSTYGKYTEFILKFPFVK